MKHGFLLTLCLLGVLSAPAQNRKSAPVPAIVANDEVIYHIFQRSFYDSNGDGHGDLNGIRQKLDYLQQLGVSAILLTPLYDSPFYHNYFADDFKNIDPKYGSMKDYLALVQDLHKRGMKFYMDMEPQYVTEDHIWLNDGLDNPESKYGDYIIYDDAAHTKPTSIISGIEGLTGYDGVYRKITMVNLNNPKVLEYNYSLFKFWMDPNGDGKFDDGVDGFRLDHMMDNLDNKGVLPHLFDTFWNPLISRLHKVNPNISFVAEQANWSSFGEEHFKNGGVDRVFGFRLAAAIRSFDKAQIVAAADSTFLVAPKGKQPVIFIENHDMPRFSSGVNGNLDKLKIGAALNLFIGGIPCIYYGQEIGIKGTPVKLGATDANDIPDRSAFEWYRSGDGKGMAFWYKMKGPWREEFISDKVNNGISLEAQQNNINSLWYFYHEMMIFRKANPVLISGAYKTLENNNDQVYSFERYEGNNKFVVTINLSAKSQDVTIQLTGNEKVLRKLHGDTRAVLLSDPAAPSTISLSIGPYEMDIWSIE